MKWDLAVVRLEGLADAEVLLEVATKAAGLIGNGLYGVDLKQVGDRVLVIEEGGIIETDEKLAVGRVRIGRPCHRAYAAHMRFLGELCLKVGLL